MGALATVSLVYMVHMSCKREVHAMRMQIAPLFLTNPPTVLESLLEAASAPAFALVMMSPQMATERTLKIWL